MRHLLKNSLRLCFVTSIKDKPIDEYLKLVKNAVIGGITMVQLREKASNISDVRYKAIALQSILRPMGVPLIINDFVELAAEINADGVHIGQQDMSVAQARKILGAHKIIGLSIESIDELHLANSTEGISYVTASAIFPSTTKPDCKTIWGLKGFEEMARQSRYPVTGIGGIREDNIRAIVSIPNVSGVAVVGAIDRAACPYNAARNLAKAFENKRCV